MKTKLFSIGIITLVLMVFTSCTKDEALKALKKNGAKMTAYVAGLSDEELDRRGSMPAFGGEVTTEQLIRYVIFDSAAQHFESMKTAVGK